MGGLFPLAKKYMGHTLTRTPIGDVYVPDDFPRLLPWLPFVRCLRSRSKSRGFSIVSARVVVDDKGDPVLWADPTQMLIHPASLSSDDLLRILSLAIDPEDQL